MIEIKMIELAARAAVLEVEEAAQKAAKDSRRAAIKFMKIACRAIFIVGLTALLARRLCGHPMPPVVGGVWLALLVVAVAGRWWKGSPIDPLKGYFEVLRVEGEFAPYGKYLAWLGAYCPESGAEVRDLPYWIRPSWVEMAEGVARWPLAGRKILAPLPDFGVREISTIGDLKALLSMEEVIGRDVQGLFSRSFGCEEEAVAILVAAKKAGSGIANEMLLHVPMMDEEGRFVQNSKPLLELLDLLRGEDEPELKLRVISVLSAGDGWDQVPREAKVWGQQRRVLYGEEDSLTWTWSPMYLRPWEGEVTTEVVALVLDAEGRIDLPRRRFVIGESIVDQAGLEILTSLFPRLCEIAPQSPLARRAIGRIGQAGILNLCK